MAKEFFEIFDPPPAGKKDGDKSRGEVSPPEPEAGLGGGSSAGDQGEEAARTAPPVPAPRSKGASVTLGPLGVVVALSIFALFCVCSFLIGRSAALQGAPASRPSGEDRWVISAGSYPAGDRPTPPTSSKTVLGTDTRTPTPPTKITKLLSSIRCTVPEIEAIIILGIGDWRLGLGFVSRVIG